MTRSPPPLREMMAAIIAEPSVSSVDPALDQSNRGVVELLAEWLEPMGFTCAIEPLPEQPHKANLIATLHPERPDAGGNGLVLSGHTDTVPFNGDLWTSDPFVLTERDGKLHGLGASDMKSFLALAVEAARGLRAGELRAPLTLLATADEESGMDGARTLAAKTGNHALAGCAAVIGEPTANRPVHVHKGIMMEAIHIAGRSGHSSDPHLGRNALDAMAAVLDEIIGWRAELAERYRDDRFEIPYPTLNLGHLRGGDNPNRICGQAELQIDIRTLPGMVETELRSELGERLRRRLAERASDLRITPLFPGQPPMATPADAEIVRVAERLTGHKARAVAFATEAPYLAQLGVEAVVLGPGDIACAHQPDEHLPVDRLEPTVRLLRQFIGHFCLH